MPQNLFPSPPWPTLPVQGERARYPLHRIFCVGKNYAAHAAEMGGDVDREQPIFFTKSALAFLPSGLESNYPPGTESYHYEVEFCVVLGKPLFKASPEEAADAIYGYAVGLDMTRRDIQNRSKELRLPWDMAKDVEEFGDHRPDHPQGRFRPGHRSAHPAASGWRTASGRPLVGHGLVGAGTAVAAVGALSSGAGRSVDDRNPGRGGAGEARRSSGRRCRGAGAGFGDLHRSRLRPQADGETTKPANSRGFFNWSGALE